MRRESFEHFYYQKIGLAEGCGCAEHVTRMRDIDDLVDSGAFARSPVASPSRLTWVRTAVALIGRLAQPRSRDIRI
jgi:hypothetical protein